MWSYNGLLISKFIDKSTLSMFESFSNHFCFSEVAIYNIIQVLRKQKYPEWQQYSNFTSDS